MVNKKISVLLIIEQCNPEWPSVPLVGFNFYENLRHLVNVTLVTHERNRAAIEKVVSNERIYFISEGVLLNGYYKIAEKLANRGSINWPLYHFLTYPIYASFNRRVYALFNKRVRVGEYDVVHAMTPMVPRYPVKLVDACKNLPFLLGPVNGGVPFPKGFERTARKENAHLNFIRSLGRFLIPGYRATYLKADHIFVGSTYTLNMIRKLFNISPDRLSLFFENGISSEFMKPVIRHAEKKITNLLFVGRLVPYKGADMLIEAIGMLDQSIKGRITLKIVGDGSERQTLERQVEELNLSRLVQFVGWVDQRDTVTYYSEADIFCFPSIREFGGAVVLEAMACGLPCIVVNNGGIGEYVTEDTGFRIEPLSRQHIVDLLAERIEQLVMDEELRNKMSISSTQRAFAFQWHLKAESIVEQYRALLQ